MAAKSDGAAASPRSRIPSEPEQRPAQRYSPADCCWTLGALLVFFSDGASDLWLAADYYLRREYWCFALTLVFVVAPSAVVQVLSFRWFAYDFSDAPESCGGGGGGGERFDSDAKDGLERGAGRTAGAGMLPAPPTGGRARGCCRAVVWLLQAAVHTLQLAQVWRYVRALYLGVQSRWRGEPERRRYYWRVMFESADISILRLLESFLKSAPQLVLQLSIMAVAGHVLPLQGLSASASLMSLAWMVASYQKVLRDSRDDKLPMSYKAVTVQILWHLFTIGARALAFALFASVFQLYFSIFIVAHWCIMTFWIIQGETDFCMSKWEEIIYNMMVGIVYVFCWFNVKEGRTRYRMLTYSLTVFVENVALTAAWYTYRGPRDSDFYAVVMVCVVASSYALGTFFMFVYYCLLHPDGPAPGWGYVTEKRAAAEVPASPTPGPPPDVASGPPRTLQRTKDGERGSGTDGDVFQVRPARGARAAVPRPPPGTEGLVVRIDLPRKSYPAWDAHYIDRRLRKTILVLESAAPVAPRIQYRCLGTPKEVMEYETTV
ncbi:XK-related protein 7-like [Phyllopteryx taeniolatus]|uniref:XK-related protein 7-like n=1 Tax=Phyllopteryx taeniolatus TaxID=161469 RepID=UPI002AD5B3EC|nr:XK-related protein 7-like [Phyllopteryx taeniolatus]